MGCTHCSREEALCNVFFSIILSSLWASVSVPRQSVIPPGQRGRRLDGPERFPWNAVQNLLELLSMEHLRAARRNPFSWRWDRAGSGWAWPLRGGRAVSGVGQQRQPPAHQRHVLSWACCLGEADGFAISVYPGRAEAYIPMSGLGSTAARRKK